MKHIFLLMIFIVLLVTTPVLSANLAEDSLDFDIGIDSLALINSDDPTLELELSESELLEGNSESSQAIMEIYNNFNAKITINQITEEFNYETLTQGLNYEFELNYSSNGNQEDEKVLFEPGEHAAETTFNNIDPGQAELIITANFDPEEVENEWWNLPATETETELYEDILLEVTIEKGS